MAPIIVDAGPLIAILNRLEEHHAWAAGKLRELRKPLWTCDAVLTEVCFVIAHHPVPLRNLRIMLETGLLVSDFDSQSHTSRIFDLIETYQNVPMSFADACLVCLVEQHAESHLFTLDRDFTVYRQQRRRLIPLIAPF